MFKKNTSITVICSIMIGLVFALAALAIVTVGGVLRYGQMPLTIKTESVEAMYDGTPLTSYTWSITEGALKKGHTIDVSFTGTQTNVGESDNTVTVTILDELGTDVTSDYKIQYNYGKLKVGPRMIAVTTPSATKQFDGMPLTALKYEVSEEFDGIARGHFLTALVTGYQIEIGQSSNTLSKFAIYDVFGTDVTSNYRIIVREGVLTVLGAGSGANNSFGGGLPLDPEAVLYRVYSNKTEDVYLRQMSFGDYNGRGFDMAKEYDKRIESNYSALYLTSYALAAKGSTSTALSIDPMYDIYVVPYYLSPNMNVHSIQDSDIMASGVADQTYKVSYYPEPQGELTLPASYSAYEREYRSFVYQSYLGIDMETENFMRGIIRAEALEGSDVFDTMSRVAFYVKNSARYDLDYDKELDSEKNIAIAFLDTYKTGICRHYATAATMMLRAMGIPARYTVGVLAQTEADLWTDVKAKNAHAWVEVYVDGMGWVKLEVTGSSDDTQNNEIIIKPVTVFGKYDGTPLSAKNEVTGIEELLKLGYTYEAKVNGERTELGVSSSRIVSFKLYDEQGTDVTGEYRVTYKTGKIQVYHSVLSFESNDEIKIYDGDVITKVTHKSGALMEGHRIVATPTASPNAGTALNTYEISIYDGETDVTDHYKIDKSYGVLVISRRPITVKAKDASKIYDGETLTCNEIEYDSSYLLAGHNISSFEVEGSQTGYGRSDNVVKSVEITDADGTDVTSNYEINSVTGVLRVTRT